MRPIWERSNDVQKDVYPCFFDCEKAFGRVTVYQYGRVASCRPYSELIGPNKIMVDLNKANSKQ